MLLTIGVTLVTLIFATRETSSAKHLALPNGCHLELLGTAVGNTPFSTEKQWHKLARRLLPATWTGWIPGTMRLQCGASNSLAAYFSVSTNQNTPRLPWRDHEVLDDAGALYLSMQQYCTATFGSHDYAGLTLRAFPRRDGSFRLRLKDDRGEVVGTLRIDNPVRGPFPIWTPQSLPITKTNSPVTLTLKRLVQKWAGSYSSLSPEWQSSSDSPNWSAPDVRLLDLHDATGNEGSWLSLREPAWKLRAIVHRKEVEQFSPEEKFTTPRILLPTAQEFRALNASKECNGASVLLQGFSGPGALIISNGVVFPGSFVANGVLPQSTSSRSEDWTFQRSGSNGEVERYESRKPFFLVEASGLDEHDIVRFRLVDETKREIPLEGELEGYEGYHFRQGRYPLRLYFRRFDLPPNVKRVSLEIAVSRALPFEFIIDPREIRMASTNQIREDVRP